MIKVKFDLQKILVITTLFYLLNLNLFAENDLVLRGSYPGELEVKNLRLKSNSNVKIRGKGLQISRPGKDIVSYGWIFDVAEQNVIWKSIDRHKHSYRDNGDFSIKDDVQLNKGDYKVYFLNVYNEDNFKDEFDFGDIIDDIFKGLKNDDIAYHKTYLKIEIISSNYESNIDIPLIEENQYPVVSFWEVDENEYKKEQFRINKKTELKINYTGEREEEQDYDYARIYEIPSHNVVWPNKNTIYEHAGGGEKNVQVRQTIELPEGLYEVSYVTDGSHSFSSWNTLPPGEPERWGITITCNNSDRKNISRETMKIEPLVDLRGAGNNDILSQGFEITKEIDLRVICIGEYIGDPYDYGWIEDAETNERIWEFKETNTVHAGGDPKNRKFNEIMHFEPGKYILKYISDDSHSYLAWNEAPPYEQELWGISIWPVNDNDDNYIRLFDEDEFVEKNVIVEITKVGDSRELHKDFKIDENGKVRVYAIGEGKDHRMFDTAWIKNMDNEIIIWEMTFRKTKHAGGAWKNRLYNGPVYLEKGNYRLYYKTDGSHSYNDWNSAPPRDQENYGVKIIRMK